MGNFLENSVKILKLFVRVQYTPSLSTIKHSGPTYSTQNVRQMSDKFESQYYLVGHFGLGRTFWSGY